MDPKKMSNVQIENERLILEMLNYVQLKKPSRYDSRAPPRPSANQGTIAKHWGLVTVAMAKPNSGLDMKQKRPMNQYWTGIENSIRNVCVKLNEIGAINRRIIDPSNTARDQITRQKKQVIELKKLKVGEILVLLKEAIRISEGLVALGFETPRKDVEMIKLNLKSTKALVKKIIY